MSFPATLYVLMVLLKSWLCNSSLLPEDLWLSLSAPWSRGLHQEHPLLRDLHWEPCPVSPPHYGSLASSPPWSHHSTCRLYYSWPSLYLCRIFLIRLLRAAQNSSPSWSSSKKEAQQELSILSINIIPNTVISTLQDGARARVMAVKVLKTVQFCQLPLFSEQPG